MSKKEHEISRREFLKNASITGVSSLFALSAGLSGYSFAQETEKKTPVADEKKTVKVPTRVFGKTGVSVPILSLGGIFDITANQIILKKALDWGITYWDTADCYVGGNSEIGIGNYFKRFPDARKKVFLVTKSDARDPAGMTRLLNRSLERMNTDYVDLYFIHALRNVDELSDEMKAWVEQKKKENKIKFFGFSTHRDMANQLMGASKLGWIDGIMMTYNYRLMQQDVMKRAVEACHKAGIGLTAMKTQGGGAVKTDTEAELELAGRFVKSGFTPEQAKLKAVWENEMISSVCSQISNLAIMASNVAAAVDKHELAAAEREALKTYAEQTCSGYCAGCSERCERAMGGENHIADVMRYMMYYRNYGEPERARSLFAELPLNVKNRMARRDYTAAERVCPQGIAIGDVMREAARVLS